MYHPATTPPPPPLCPNASQRWLFSVVSTLLPPPPPPLHPNAGRRWFFFGHSINTSATTSLASKHKLEVVFLGIPMRLPPPPPPSCSNASWRWFFSVVSTHLPLPPPPSHPNVSWDLWGVSTLGGILPAVSMMGWCETYTLPCSIVFPGFWDGM